MYSSERLTPSNDELGVRTHEIGVPQPRPDRGVITNNWKNEPSSQAYSAKFSNFHSIDKLGVEIGSFQCGLNLVSKVEQSGSTQSEIRTTNRWIQSTRNLHVVRGWYVLESSRRQGLTYFDGKTSLTPPEKTGENPSACNLHWTHGKNPSARRREYL